ncbi:MAG: PAS domain S-box protein [Arenibacter algicola]
MKDYSMLFQCSPFSNWVYDLENGKIVEVNEAALGLFGYGREDFLGLSINEIVMDPDILQFLISNNEVEQYAQFQSVNIKTKCGALKYCKLLCQKVIFQQRNCAMVTAHAMRQLDENKYTQKGDQSSRTSDVSNLGYWKYDYVNDSLSLSDGVFAIWGRNRRDMSLTMENILNFLPKGDRDLFYDNMASLFYGHKDMDFEHCILLPDGSRRWVRERGKLISNIEGEPHSFEGTVQDITLRCVEEQRLKLMESVVTHTNDAVMITDAALLEGHGPKIVYVNRAFTQMTGFKPEEIIGSTPDILRGPKTDLNALQRFQKTLADGKPSEIVVTNYRKNGSPYWIHIAASPVKDSEGTVSHYIEIQRDVTTKINAQSEKNFLAKISATFNEKKGLSSSLDRICKLVTFYGDFTFCEVWLPSIHKNSLRFSAMFGKNEAGETFYEHSRDVHEMELGDGLPGTVWKTGQSVLWGNIDRNNLFIRKKAAQRSKIKSVLGIPLKHQGNFVGVMVVGTPENEKHFKAHYPVLSKLEDCLGSEISRKRMEEDLTYLFETLPDLICLFDFKGNFLKVNKAGCNILGYGEDELVGNSFEKFIHGEDREISDGLVQKIRDGLETFEIENRYITKAGNLVWLSWHCRIVMDEGVVYATAKDITKAKKLQEVVSDASRLAKIGGWEMDMISKKLTWSKGVHQIHETDPEVYTPELERAINFYRADHREKVRNKVGLALEKGEAFDYEAAFISAKHNEKWVRAIGQAEMVNGKCVRLTGSLQDITQLKETEHRLLALSNDLPGVTFQYYLYPDGTGKMSSVSQKSQEIYNLSPAQCKENANLIWDRIKKGGDHKALLQDIQKSIETLTQWHSRWRYVLQNGKIRWHEGFGTPYRLADGTILFNSMVFDITEEVKLSHLLEETSELSQIGSWEMDLLAAPGNDVMYWSPMVQKIFEVDGRYNTTLSGGLEFLTPESRPLVEKGIEELIERGSEYDKEVLLKTGTGRGKWVRIIGKSERVNGVCTKIYGSIQDIHTMKTTQLQLKEILGSISDAFYALDKDWNFTFFNREAENLLGKKSDEVLGKSLWELFSPTLGTELETVYKRVAKEGVAESFEYLYPGNGSWYEINTYPSNGGISVYFKNINDRKKAEAALKSAYQEKNIILESIGDAFFAMKEDFTVTYWNKTAERLIGVKREDLIGKNLWEVFPDAVDLPSYTNYHKVMYTKEPITFEDYYGAWLEVNAYPSEEGISVFFRDITQKKKANEKILYKTEQLDIIAEMNTELLNFDNWFKVIDKTFGRVGECVKVDRIYYFQNSVNEITGELETSQRLEWSNAGVDSQINNPSLQNVPFSTTQDFMQPLAQNKPFKAIVGEMRDSVTKKLLVEQDIKSILVLPIFINKEFWGFIGFDDCKIEKHWNHDEIFFLKTITTNLSAAIEASLTNKELERSYAEKNQILESIDDAFFAVDKGWTVTYWNNQAEHLLGRKREDIIGKNLLKEYADVIELGFYAQFNQAMATGVKVTFEGFYPALRKWFEVSAYPSPEGLSVYFKDVTMRKEIDIQIRQANERFEKVAQATTDAIWDWDIENGVIVRSDGFERLFGNNVKKCLKESEIWEDSFHPEDLPKIRSSLQETLLDPFKEFWSKEYRIVHEKEGVKTVIDKGAIIRKESGEAVRMVGAITDITEKQEYIETIETQNKKLRNIAWTQSHVVRSPLSRILGIINLLDMEPLDSEDVPYLLDQIKVSGKELDEIIGKIVKETRSIRI